MLPLPNKTHDVVQPEQVWEECGEAGFKTITLAQTGQFVEQHIHGDSHATLVCNGRARGWVEGKHVGDKGPGEAFWVEAGKKHHFQALEPKTRLSCVTFIKGA